MVKPLQERCFSKTCLFFQWLWRKMQTWVNCWLTYHLCCLQDNWSLQRSKLSLSQFWQNMMETTVNKRICSSNKDWETMCKCAKTVDVDSEGGFFIYIYISLYATCNCSKGPSVYTWKNRCHDLNSISTTCLFCFIVQSLVRFTGGENNCTF